MINLVWLIPLFPLLGFLLTGLFYKRLTHSFSGWFVSLMVLFSFILSTGIFIELWNGANAQNIILFDWIKTGNVSLPFEFLVDSLSATMLMIVTGVGFLIHVYSIGYMHDDEGFNRFFSYMNLFVFFMLILVLGGSYTIMFIGWEGVGLCSYLLIGFWFKNNDYNNAAKKAFIMNRIGDLGFLLGMFLIFWHYGSLTYTEVFENVKIVSTNSEIMTWATILLFIGAIGKSAQIPLFTWLPDAMAGPTPVSALIHAATMVTAGVYMVARSNTLYILAPVTLNIIAGIGLATALMAALIALFQNDIKKVLAYSTVSQLGLMFVGLGVRAFTGAIFHLTTHAFFKALLFLAAGSVIHALHGEQDIRNMGGLRKKIPLTFFIFLIGTLAISGIPPFAGFFSKDEILAGIYSENQFVWILAILTSMLTGFYMFRLLFLTFSGKFRGTNESKIHESPKIMTIPLLLLALLSTIGGFAGIPEGFGTHFLKGFLSPVFENPALIHHDIHSLSTEIILMTVAMILTLTTIALAWQTFVKKAKIPAEESTERKGIMKLLYDKFYIDELYNMIIIKPVKYFSKLFYEIIELKLIDNIVEKTGKMTIKTGHTLRFIQNGHVGFYLAAMVIGIILVLLFNL